MSGRIYTNQENIIFLDITVKIEYKEWVTQDSEISNRKKFVIE